jgi:hypothetical protein
MALAPAAAGGAAVVAAAAVAGDINGDRISSLQDQLKNLETMKKQKAKEVKLEKAKRARLMAKAASNLSVDELTQVLTAKVAQAKAKAQAKARAVAIPAVAVAVAAAAGDEGGDEGAAGPGAP